MSTRSKIAELRKRIEELEKACRVQTDALVCALLIIGEFAHMTKSVTNSDHLDVETFEQAGKCLEENMAWLEAYGFTDNNFPTGKWGSAQEKTPHRIHLRLITNNTDKEREE